MARSVSVALTPAAVGNLAGSTALVVDVLRATTTLTQAFANGLSEVIPCATVEEARAEQARRPGSLLGGEQASVRVPGFDFGNSPGEYTAERVAGKHLVFVSTNGSYALRAARMARHIVLAAFVNASAAVGRAAKASRVVVVCAGKERRLSLEDTACAGLLVRRLVERGFEPQGEDARVAMLVAPVDAIEVRRILEGSDHGRGLIGMGGEYARDVERAAALDSIDEAFEVRP